MTAFEEGLPDLENLRDLDLGLNHITKLEEFEKLSIFTSMKSLDVKQNPFIDNNEKNYIFKLISKLPDLEVINDFPVSYSSSKLPSVMILNKIKILRLRGT